MKLTEAKLKQIILEEVKNRMRQQLEEQVIQMFIDEGTMDKIRRAEIPDSWKRAGALLGIGGALAGGTWFGGEYATYAQKKSLENQIGQVMQDTASKVNRLQNFMEISRIPDAAGAPVGKPVTDTMGAIRQFDKAHVHDWTPTGHALAPGFGLPDENFVYVPANEIGDKEVLPFVGMTKQDYELLLRAFYLDDPGGKGDQRLKALVQGGEKGSSMYWAYGGGDDPLFGFWQEAAPKGQRGMMLPPEWSVAYELLQKREARESGTKAEPAPPQGEIPLGSSSDDLGIPLDQTTWKEMKTIIKKELAKLL